MKKNGKLKYIILIFVCLNCIGACIFLNLWYQALEKDDGEALEALRDSIKRFETVIVQTEAPVSDETEPVTDTYTDTAQSASTDVLETAQTTEPIQTLPQSELLDFEPLWEVNPEICAWLEIDGTRIDYPVLQSKDSDKKYLNTAYDGSPYIGGALYTEATYNNNDFDDPVTVIYGHTMRSGNLFGTLQKTYSVESTFYECSDIRLYLPGETREYTVFAAVPYSRIHLLHTYDFSNTYWYNRFFGDARRIREIGANINEDICPEAGDRVIIMSVCLSEDTARRYLVMAVYNEDLADNSAEPSK